MASKRPLGFSSTVFRKKFRAGMTVRKYRDNEIVFSQGDTADAVFYIQSGTVKLTVASTRSKKAIIAVLLRGSFFQFFNFSQKRLARVLLFGQIPKESKPENPLKVSQATLAEMVGTTRARVSKFMNGFKKKGFVRYNGGLQIKSALIIAFLQSRPMSFVTKE
jgi:CRP-like cAMP-binding protein